MLPLVINEDMLIDKEQHLCIIYESFNYRNETAKQFTNNSHSLGQIDMEKSLKAHTIKSLVKH